MASRLDKIGADRNARQFPSRDVVPTAVPSLGRLLDNGDLSISVRERGVTRRLDRIEEADAAAPPLSDVGVSALLSLVEEHNVLSSGCAGWMTDCTLLASDAPGLVADGATALFVAMFDGSRTTPDQRQNIATLLWFGTTDGGDWELLEDYGFGRWAEMPAFRDTAERDAWFDAVRNGELPLADVTVKGVRIGEDLLVPAGQSSPD